MAVRTMKKFKEIRQVTEGWVSGHPIKWQGKYIKHTGGYGKVTAEHPTHVEVFNGISHYPVLKSDVHAHHDKSVDNEWLDAGRQTSVGAESVIDQQVGEFLDEDVVLDEGKRKKFLGQFRGRTATGQKANPIDVEPKLHLNKGKALKAIRSKGF